MIADEVSRRLRRSEERILMTEMAEAMGMNEHKLKRLLSEEGIRFSALRDKEWMRRVYMHKPVSHVEGARLLGMSRGKTFSNWFQRTTGKNYLVWRKEAKW